MMLYMILLVFAVGLTSMIAAMKWDSIVMSVIALASWIMLTIGTVYVEIPYQIAVNNTVSTGMHGVYTVGMPWFFLILVFVHIFHIYYLGFRVGGAE